MPRRTLCGLVTEPVQMGGPRLRFAQPVRAGPGENPGLGPEVTCACVCVYMRVSLTCAFPL